MNLEEKKNNIEWYDNPSIITWLIILIISVIILSSQSFSINSNIDPIRMFQDILNHNITYMIALVYFVSLKTKLGKKYFDYSNIFMIVVFFITFITAILTVFQSFGLVTLLSLAIHMLILIYFFHIFMRGTRLWKEFDLSKSPFNELTNEWFFYAVVIIEVILFTVNLISTATFNGTVLATFDCIYVILFARYIYLYGTYLDFIKVNTKNTGNFDKYKEKVNDIASDIGEKIEDVCEQVTDTISDVTSNKTENTLEKSVNDKPQNKEKEGDKSNKKSEKKGSK